MADNRYGDGTAPGYKGAAAAYQYVINLPTFDKRLKALYAHWNEHKKDHWGAAEALSVATPPASDDLRYLKSSALNIWLLGFEFPETVMVFTRKQMHILCSQKKASLLESVKSAANKAVGLDVVLHIKAENDDGVALMDSIFSAIFALSMEDVPVVGHIAEEAPQGKLLEAWSGKLKDPKIRLTDITTGLSDLFAVKDENEINCIKKAAFLSASVLKDYMVPKLENIVDEEKKVTHLSLMDEVEKVILVPTKINVKLNAANIDICYHPIFQSGRDFDLRPNGDFDLRPRDAINDENLYYDSGSVIICANGSRYCSYCSNVVRTILIGATSTQSNAYEVLLKAHEAAIGALKPGNKASDAYQAAFSVVEKNAPELLPNLTKSAGTGIGLEFSESGLNLNSENEKVLRENMVFNVSIGFQNLLTDINKPKSQNISLLLADTVIVKLVPEVLTSKSSKAVKDVAYSFSDGEEEEETPKDRNNVSLAEALSSKASLQADNQEMSKEELQRQHQAEVAQQKNEETARRLAGDGSGTGDSRGSARSSSVLTAYENLHKELLIDIDPKNEAILLRISGSMKSFHVTEIRTACFEQDTNKITIVFDEPGTAFDPHDSNTLQYQNSIYFDVCMGSKDPSHSIALVQSIKTLRRQVMSREPEKFERATLVPQEKLIFRVSYKSKPIRLSNLWIRPVFGGRRRKLTGTLEAHINGFRFTTSRADDRVDIMFANIKHAFFQPAKEQVKITLIHFHLHNHIMVGNKTTKDVQFYIEGTIKTGLQFPIFVNKVTKELWVHPKFKSLDLKFDPPSGVAGFRGIPYKANSAFIIPTSSCLIDLIEDPFIVITLSEIEIVNLEWVGQEQKKFDMAIEFKDDKRDVMRIDSIPSTSLDGIKQWLKKTDLKYDESGLEREAVNADKEMNESDSEEERKRKNPGSGGSSPKEGQASLG